MSGFKFCVECGAKVVARDNFCGECGLAFNVKTAGTSGAPPEKIPKEPLVTSVPYTASYLPGAGRSTAATDDYHSGDSDAGGHKNALIMVIALLAILFLGGGGMYWWLTREEEPRAAHNISAPVVPQNNINTPGGEPLEKDITNKADLSRAAAYLSAPGLKCTFFVNYPNGLSGIVDRFSGQAVPDEAIRISEVEVGIERGEEYGFGFHYVERSDGTYYILDNAPYEVFPVLKNNLTIGQTWNYQNEWGQIIWTVLDMGINLDLGFAKFADCLLVEENNRAVGWHALTYYAPGYGSILVISPDGTLEYYKMTAMTKLDLGEAADMIKKWSPNYQDIRNDRSQSY